MAQLSPTPAVQVHVFAPAVLATPAHVEQAIGILQMPAATDAMRVVVTSLPAPLQAPLQALLDAPSPASERLDAALTLSRRCMDDLAEALVAPAERPLLARKLGALMDEVAVALRARTEDDTPRYDLVRARFLRAAAFILAAACRSAGLDAVVFDATCFFRSDAAHGAARVRLDETRLLVHAQFSGLPPSRIAVVTGGLAATASGTPTTLGPNGHDYTALVLADLLGAGQVHLWTLQPGILSADPSLVPEAFPLAHLNYREAAELAYANAGLLPPHSLYPARRSGIPIRVRSVEQLDAPGTLISNDAPTSQRDAKAVTTIRDLALLTVEGAGMVGTPGITARALEAVAARGINLLLVSQAATEQSLGIVVRAAEGDRAARAVSEALSVEQARGDISRISVLPHVAVVSVVGDGMRYRPGLTGRMFSTLGRSGINVLSIAEGASETNISAVVDEADVARAAQSLHEAFPLGRNRVHVFLFGAGTVGKMLLDMMAHQAPELLASMNLNLQLVGLANSRHMAWDVTGIPFAEARSRLRSAQQHVNLRTIVERLTASRLERLIAIDVTASDDVAQLYPELLEHNIAVITPNKRANTLDYAFYERLHRAARTRQIPYFYETTVGAGLPVISTLRDLLRTGDTVERIEGIFSGTLAYLFNTLTRGASFADALRTARSLGYTEPDPRDDLSGEDVARKLLILARETGLRIERDAVSVESLVPPALRTGSVKAFLEALDDANDAWATRIAEAAARGETLQYIGTLDADGLRVGVRAVGPDSPFARLSGTDNMILFTTRRYKTTPLVIQGPGAGPDVTAAGILADVIKAAELVS